MSDFFAPKLTRLELFNFRNYSALRVASAAPAIVLTGHNGTGKTNILEAISLLSPGRGLRNAALDRLLRQESQGGCAVRADVTQPGSSVRLATGVRLSPQGKPQRPVFIDDVTQSSQNCLQDYVSVQWLVPRLDRLFVDASAERRRFFDRLVYAFFPEHLRHLQHYEHYRREWLRLLQLGARDSAWFDSIEAALAEHAVPIALARVTLAERLNACPLLSPHFPPITLFWQGWLEQLPDDASRSDQYRDYLKKQRHLRKPDANLSIDGVHRSDLRATHRQKNLDAALCSTGEQKALLVALMLASMQEQRTVTGRLPIFLFDEATAHFDAPRRAALFEALTLLGGQVWYTGTEPSLFTPLRGLADFLTVQDCSLHPCPADVAA